MSERSGRLIGQIQKIFRDKFPQYISLIPKIHSIYEKRKRADHRDVVYNELEARRIVEDAKNIVLTLKKLL